MREIYDLENERLKIANRLQIATFLSVVFGIIAFAIFYLYFKEEIISSVFVAFFITAFVYGLIKTYLTVDFNRNFKDIAMTKIIHSLDENLIYEPENFIKYSEFQIPQIYQAPDSYTGNDLISGNISEVEFKFSDIFSQRRVEIVDHKGNRVVHYETIFKGLLFIADFHKNFTSTTYALSRGRSVGLPRVEMDSSEFERIFNVYSSDSVNAFYILTPNLMERLLKIREIFNSPINLAFLDSKIYIYIEFGRDSFEPDITKTLVGKSSILMAYRDQISSIINLVSELNLDRKIWKVKEI